MKKSNKHSAMKASNGVSQIVSACNDWRPHVINQKPSRAGNTICWRNYTNTKTAWPPKAEDVLFLANTGQYTFQVDVDSGAIVQMFYMFDQSGETLLKARLCYYEIHSDFVETDQIVPSPDLTCEAVRFDYDPNEAVELVHCACHLHFSSFPQTRIPVLGVPTPKQFIELVFCWFHPEVYSERWGGKSQFNPHEERLLKLNTPELKHNFKEIEKLITAVVIPSSIPRL